MRRSRSKEEFRALSASGLVAVLVLALVAPAAATDSGVLHVFEPGLEPRWTMLKLDSAAGGELRVQIAWPELRCPMAWGFYFFQGPPEDATQLRSVTFNFAHGRSGVEAYTTEPAASFEAMEYEGAQRCPSGAGFELRFPELPAGPLYLLEFTAGLPFHAKAVLAEHSGSFDIMDVSSGDRTFYLNSSGFEGGSHVGVHSPPVCVRPDVTQESLCDPCCHWVGDTLFGADLSVDRHSALTFKEHPLFHFGPSARFEVSNASVTTPLGTVLTAPESLSATAAGLRVGATSTSIRTHGTGPEWPAGEYAFDIALNANGDPEYGGPWRLYAVDFHFPEEEATEGIR